jgi:hypothetical protein
LTKRLAKRRPSISIVQKILRFIFPFVLAGFFFGQALTKHETGWAVICAVLLVVVVLSPLYEAKVRQGIRRARRPRRG